MKQHFLAFVAIALLLFVAVGCTSRYEKYEHLVEQRIGAGSDAYCSFEDKGTIRNGIIHGLVAIPQNDSNCEVLIKEYSLYYDRPSDNTTSIKIEDWSEELGCVKQSEVSAICKGYERWRQNNGLG